MLLTNEDERRIKKWFFAIIDVLNHNENYMTHYFYCPYHKDLVMKVEFTNRWGYELMIIEEPPQLSSLNLR